MTATSECFTHRHRTRAATARCWASTAFRWWRRSITGDGPCGVLTQHDGRLSVRLYATDAEARAVVAVLDEVEDRAHQLVRVA